jgi:hypothetical protein
MKSQIIFRAVEQLKRRQLGMIVFLNDVITLFSARTCLTSGKISETGLKTMNSGKLMKLYDFSQPRPTAYTDWRYASLVSVLDGYELRTAISWNARRFLIAWTD